MSTGHQEWVDWARKKRRDTERQERRIEKLKGASAERVARTGAEADIAATGLAYGPESVRAKELALDKELFDAWMAGEGKGGTPRKPGIPIPGLDDKRPVITTGPVTNVSGQRPRPGGDYAGLGAWTGGAFHEKAFQRGERRLLGKRRRFKPYVGGALRMLTSPTPEVGRRVSRIGLKKAKTFWDFLKRVGTEEY